MRLGKWYYMPNTMPVKPEDYGYGIFARHSFSDTLLLSSLCMDVQSLHAQNHPDIFKMPESEDFAALFYGMLADSSSDDFYRRRGWTGHGYILCKLVERPENPFTFAARFLHIDQISVRPTARGQGVGAALIQQAELLGQGIRCTEDPAEFMGLQSRRPCLLRTFGVSEIQFPLLEEL